MPYALGNVEKFLRDKAIPPKQAKVVLARAEERLENGLIAASNIRWVLGESTITHAFQKAAACDPEHRRIIQVASDPAKELAGS